MSYEMKMIQDRLVGLHNLVKDIEGNTNEMSLDMRNFTSELENMDTEKKVEVPGVKIRKYLDTWEQDCPITTQDEIKDFAVSAQLVHHCLE